MKEVKKMSIQDHNLHGSKFKFRHSTDLEFTSLLDLVGATYVLRELYVSKRGKPIVCMTRGDEVFLCGLPKFYCDVCMDMLADSEVLDQINEGKALVYIYKRLSPTLGKEFAQVKFLDAE